MRQGATMSENTTTIGIGALAHLVRAARSVGDELSPEETAEALWPAFKEAVRAAHADMEAELGEKAARWQEVRRGE